MTASLENQYSNSFRRLLRALDSRLLGKIKQYKGKKEDIKSFLA
jgi:hypothetical protein